MKDTFNSLGVGLCLASLLIYFLMVGLDRSFLVPLSVMLIVPLCLIGIMPMLYLTRSAVNVQSLLGFIFIVGIKVANSVLMTDYAQELRRHEGLSPIEAIRKAAGLRVRPITMTALAAFFALIPGRWRSSGAARRTPRWPGRSSAVCWPASRRRCSSCRRSTRCSSATRADREERTARLAAIRLTGTDMPIRLRRSSGTTT